MIVYLNLRIISILRVIVMIREALLLPVDTWYESGIAMLPHFSSYLTFHHQSYLQFHLDSRFPFDCVCKKKKIYEGLSILQCYGKCSRPEWDSLSFFSILMTWVYEFWWIKVKMKLRHDETNWNRWNGYLGPTELASFSQAGGQKWGLMHDTFPGLLSLNSSTRERHFSTTDLVFKLELCTDFSKWHKAYWSL